jgi:transcriptional regulator with XRE-family HTH domain
VDKSQTWYVKLKRERLRRGWSQADLAKRVGSNTKTISRWERNEASPGPFLRQKLAATFEMSIEELGLFSEEETEEIEVNNLVSTLSSTSEWGEAPHVERFLGRKQELDAVSQWIIHDACRMMVILGFGGIGKTTFATTLAKKLRDTGNSLSCLLLYESSTACSFLITSSPCYQQDRVRVSIDKDTRTTGDCCGSSAKQIMPVACS